MTDRIREVLEAVARGALSPDAGASVLREGPQTDLGFAVVDDDRPVRTGLPEVIFGQGKTPEQLVALLEHLVGRGHGALATRVEPDKARAVRAVLPGAVYEAVPRLLWLVPDGVEPFRTTSTRPLWVVSAGTSDLPVAEEAARCGEWFGLEVHRAWDVGVAGLHRVLARRDDLAGAHAIIAVAGMEGALPGVVSGLVRAPVVAVPTSIGYGTHLGGFAPLLAMLNACASGVSVVNVDNGFGAALVAWRILEGAR